MLQKRVNSDPAALLGSNWIWLLGITVLAGMRWLMMSSPDLFRSTLPTHWFWGETLGLTRISLNALSSWIILVIVPSGILYLLRSRTQLSLRDSFGLRSPIFDTRIVKLSFVALLASALLVGAIGPCLSESVRRAYPTWTAAGRSPWNLLLSESLTLALILATELFYRGAALKILHRWFGIAAVYILLPIYCLDHIGAPGPELIGSLLTGAVLGHLALKTKSIWPGFAIHSLAALTVDLCSLAFEKQLWFQT